jgi:UDP-glucose 4-epimerase
MRFTQTGLRSQGLVDLLRSAQFDVVCHLDFRECVAHTEAMFDHNVMGTIHLFGACVQTGVKRIVTMSSTAVYGAHPTNPAFLTENHPLQGSRNYGTTRYLLENERFWGKFRKTNPEISITTLRFPNIVGGTCDTPMTRFLGEPRAPMLLGFDPMLQLIHEDDVVGALAHAVENEVAGVFNVGAEAMPLLKLLALAKKMPLALPHPLLELGIGLLNGQIGKLMPIELPYLRYRWVADVAQMSEKLGFYPERSGEDGVREVRAGISQQKYAHLIEQTMSQGEQLRQMVDQYRQHGEDME